MPATILIVEDEKNTREGLVLALEEHYDVYEVSDAESALQMMDEDEFDVILTDLKMAGKSGLSVIDKAVSLSYKPICIMMTAYGNVETAVEAMKRGAFDFLTKPVNLAKLELVIKRALQSKSMEKENVELHRRLDQKFKFEGIIGNSNAITKVIDEIKQVASSKATVLLEGETGTGKELFAQMVHQNSPRAHQSFVPVHCAALPSNLLESELFGHEKGAFTGAMHKRIGRFEAANGGTLFLDEIGEIDASTQIKLLRFLETKTFERVGGMNSIKVDVRLVCATNRNLEKMVKAGEFREDLFYRLDVVRVNLPPLRERKEDIPLLIKHYIEFFCRENEMDPPQIKPEAMRLLADYRWPGNVRELRNFCENLVVMREGATITSFDLEPKYHTSDLMEEHTQLTLKTKFANIPKEDKEKIAIRRALVESEGSRTIAAKLLGISRRTLHRKLLKWPEMDVRNK